jgi:sugar/nucleoside kinase (ribokinase family)
MMAKRIEIAGVGCCLVDYLYNNISFGSETFLKYISRKSGDGGLVPGQLVFTEEFEKYSGKDLGSVITTIAKGQKADSVNIGGPGIVALIHAAQMLEGSNCQIRFYGARGHDEAGSYLNDTLNKFPVDIEHYKSLEGATPSTVVMSDPEYQSGTGERVFINSIGAAGNYLPQYLGSQFFEADVVVFGGTALVPVIHDNLTELLTRAKNNGCITVVNTVYDFRNEKMNPGQRWPMGNTSRSYANIDLLITNRQEALRLSGKTKLQEAVSFFSEMGTGAALITNGANNIMLFATNKSIFQELGPTEMPVSAAILEETGKANTGDTTGCGDNFAGGAIASVVKQLQEGKDKLSLTEAASWGIVSGGFSCFYLGGTYHQMKPGEKQKLIKQYYKAYLKQTVNG